MAFNAIQIRQIYGGGPKDLFLSWGVFQTPVFGPPLHNLILATPLNITQKSQRMRPSTD